MGARANGQSLIGGVFILCNVTIGLAILNMPYAFKLVGKMMILVMLFIGGLSMFTAYLVSKAIEFAGTLAESDSVAVEYRDWGFLAEVAFGKFSRRAAKFCVRGELVVFILSFLCTLGVHVNLLLPIISIELGVIISSIATFIMSYLPLRLLGKVALLANLAYVVVAALLYYSEYVALDQPDTPGLAELVADNWNRVGIVDALPSIPTATGICVFAWDANSVVPTIATSLAKTSNIKHVILITFPVAVGTAMLIGLSGYLVLGPHTKQVFTENLGEVYWWKPEGETLLGMSWMRTLAAVSVTIKLGATIPCFMCPLLASTEAGIRNPMMKNLWRALLVLAMGMVACIFRNHVVVAVALAGATFGNIMIFILPCTVYYGIKRRVRRVGCAEASMLAAIVGLGITLMAYGVYDAMRQLLTA